MSKNSLAYFGGKKTISYKMPARKSINTFEVRALNSAINYYRKKNKEIGFQDHFEKIYSKKFSQFLGGGYSDVVATGTLALMNAIQSLELPKGSEILTSPISDPGTLSAIIMLGHKPKLMDSEENSYAINFENLKKRTTKNTKAVLLVHPVGQSIKMKKIVKFLKKKKIYLIEDCSQSHGAKCFACKGCKCEKKVGTFGDIAAFSTMYKKAHVTGSTGGVVFTKRKSLHLKALAYADRGKPIWKGEKISKNPKKYLFPSLNINSNEFSCAVGISSLSRINKTIEKRIKLCKYLTKKFEKYSKFCVPIEFTKFDSPFFLPVYFKGSQFVKKNKFAQMLIAEGVQCNDRYNYLVSEWPWVKKYLIDKFKTKNAENFVNTSFNLYIHENYNYKNMDDIIYAVQKVESFFLEN